MIRIPTMLMALFAFISPALAQTYEEVQQQQQMYSEKIRAEIELNQQREEMEKIQRENEKTLEAQREEIEKQKEEIHKMRRDQGLAY